MQVITLTPEEFQKKCEMLASLLTQRHPGNFDTTVGIQTGGVWVRDAMAKSLPEKYLGTNQEVSLQRPTTKNKNRHAFKILSRLPRHLLNIMRIAEACILDLRHQLNKSHQLPEVALDNKLAAILSEKGTPEVLIVDDAVDSGTTLSAVCKSILKANPSAKITSVVITVTTNSPEIQPDIALYRNRTLIRFPWSKDFHR